MWEACHSNEPGCGYWLILWVALFTIPVIAYEVFNDYNPRGVTALWLYTKQLLLFVGLWITGAVSIAAPFIPKQLTGGADLTVFLLSIYFIAGRAWQKWHQLWHARDLYLVYSHANTVVRGYQHAKRRLPSELVTAPGIENESVAKHVDATFASIAEQGIVGMEHDEVWSEARGFSMGAGIHEYKEQALACYGARYELTKLYSITVQFCDMNYVINAYDVSALFYIAGIRQKLTLSDWALKSDEFINKAISASGVPSWKAAQKKAIRDHYRLSNLELRHRKGLVPLADQPGMGGLTRIDPEDLQESHHSNPYQALFDQVKFDTMVMICELMGIGDFLAGRQRQPPLAMKLIKAYFVEKRWESMRAQIDFGAEQDVDELLWAQWICSALKKVPTALALAVSVCSATLDEEAAAETLALCLRVSLGGDLKRAAPNLNVQYASVSRPFSELTEPGRGLTGDLTVQLHTLADMVERGQEVCNRTERDAARKVLDLACEHCRTVFGRNAFVSSKVVKDV